MGIDAGKLCGKIIEKIMENAQNLAESGPFSAQFHRDAGRLSGLVEALISLDPGDQANDASERLCAAAQHRMSVSDESDSAKECRYNDSAASAMWEIAEEVANMPFAPSVRKASQTAPAAVPAKRSEEAVADILATAYASDDKNTEARVDGNGNGGGGRKKWQRKAPLVKVNDIVVWILEQKEKGTESVTVDDIAKQFFAKGRQYNAARSVALKAAHAMADRGIVNDDFLKIGRMSLTEHGVFQAEKLRGPVFSMDSEAAPASGQKDDPDA